MRVAQLKATQVPARATRRHKTTNRSMDGSHSSGVSAQTNRGPKPSIRIHQARANIKDSIRRISKNQNVSDKKRGKDFKLKFWSPDPFESGEARVQKKVLRAREGSEDVALVTKKENLEEAQRRRKVEEFLKVLVDRTGLNYGGNEPNALKKKIRSVFKGWKNNSVAEFFDFKSNKELYKIKVLLSNIKSRIICPVLNTLDDFC